MSAASASNFFAALPARLTAAEEDLRQCMLRTASAARSVLQDSRVTLQEWVERRMPAELEFRVCANGKATIEPAQASAPGRGKGAAQGKGSSTKGAANPNGGKGSKEDLEAFFKSLPGDSFRQEEEKLREAIINSITNGPIQASKISAEPQVASISRTFLPRYVPLISWVKRRIGAEVSVENGVCKLIDEGSDGIAGAAVGEEVLEDKESWFGKLPTDSFLQEEEQLREAILDFLAGWQSKALATISDAEKDQGVSSVSSRLLPQNVPLSDWIVHRIGAEIELKSDARGQLNINILTAAVKKAVSDKFKERQARQAAQASRGKSATQGKGSSAKGAANPNGGKGSKEDSEAFFKSLPADSFRQEEEKLREALLDFLEKWFTSSPDGPPPALSDLMGDQAIARWKAALLPKGVFLKDWVETRIGGEIRTSRTENGQVHFFADGQWSPSQQKAADSAKASQSKGAGKRTSAEGTPPQAERKMSGEAFFKSLPAESFLQEEETLRQALLDFLGVYRGAGPPKLQSAGMDTKIRTSAQALLPKGSGLPMLKDWIDKRIGGEIETREMGGEGTVFALRGKLEELLERARGRRAAPATPGGAPPTTGGAVKRKADALDGGAGGCAKGKGKQAKKGGSYGRP